AGRGDAPAVRCGERTVSYAELAGEAAAVAAALHATGVRPEERVMLLMPDTVELLAGILGAMRLGAVAVPISTMLTAADLATVLRDSRARVLLTSPAFGPIVGEAVAQTPDLAEVVGAPALSWEDFLAAGAEAGPVAVDRTTGDSPALWLYTSGTTGTPKGAMHRHANFRHVVECYAETVLR